MWIFKRCNAFVLKIFIRRKKMFRECENFLRVVYLHRGKGRERDYACRLQIEEQAQLSSAFLVETAVSNFKSIIIRQVGWCALFHLRLYGVERRELRIFLHQAGYPISGVTSRPVTAFNRLDYRSTLLQSNARNRDNIHAMGISEKSVFLSIIYTVSTVNVFQ